ncbi:hypothetical protein EHF33_04245 [Deinococcus psychrotolerans]|uniref:Uncharacterized protein n=1 Tax=Deinococcus psychrotolerans TaxID=2489213 RepID=A0A3G8YLQ6_9DEIO|nr:hypothetical protein [Deinococcus psychrotolerans]AZI42056.1 hypothetical protein EHF33_04245 [Deinococcus psychrotolerans]
MKQINKGLLGLIGAATLLSACSVTVTPAPNGGGSSVTLNAVTSYNSEYTLASSTVDQNGRTLAAGTNVICDDRNTQLQVGVSWTGGLQRIGIQFTGVKYGQTTKQRIFGDRYSSPDYSGNGLATITIGSGVAPLKVSSGLSAQSIVPTPINTTYVKGYTYVQAIGEDQNGNVSNVVESVTAIPVVNCS